MQVVHIRIRGNNKNKFSTVRTDQLWSANWSAWLSTVSSFTNLHKTHTPLQAVLIVHSSLKPIDSKGNTARKDGGSTVDEGDNDGLALKVIVVLVVAGKSYE